MKELLIFIIFIICVSCDKIVDRKILGTKYEPPTTRFAYEFTPPMFLPVPEKYFILMEITYEDGSKQNRYIQCSYKQYQAVIRTNK